MLRGTGQNDEAREKVRVWTLGEIWLKQLQLQV